MKVGANPIRTWLKKHRKDVSSPEIQMQMKIPTARDLELSGWYQNNCLLVSPTEAAAFNRKIRAEYRHLFKAASRHLKKSSILRKGRKQYSVWFTEKDNPIPHPIFMICRPTQAELLANIAFILSHEYPELIG